MTDIDIIVRKYGNGDIGCEEALSSVMYLHNNGTKFIHSLIEKEEIHRAQLSKNMDTYKNGSNISDYNNTFSQWNKSNLVLFDLKDILCRMGEDI